MAPSSYWSRSICRTGWNSRFSSLCLQRGSPLSRAALSDTPAAARDPRLGAGAARRRLREQRRAQELPGLLERLRAEFPPEQLTWLFPDVPRFYGDILEQMRRSAGELNFNDGLIALACRERQIRLLASFDGNFDMLTWVTRVATPDEVAAALAAPPPPAAGAPESLEPR